MKQNDFYYEIKEDMVTKNKSNMNRILGLVKDEVIKKIRDYPGRIYYKDKNSFLENCSNIGSLKNVISLAAMNIKDKVVKTDELKQRKNQKRKE